MKRITYGIAGFCLLLLTGCGRTRGTEDKTLLPENKPIVRYQDSSEAVTPTEQPNDSALVTDNTITYEGIQKDSIQTIVYAVPPLDHLRAMVDQMIHVQDSLANDDPNQDNRVLAPYRQQVNKATENYKRIASAGISMPENFPTLLRLNRPIPAGDTAGGQLPLVRPSFFSAGTNFFFAGGAPFLTKLEPEENTDFSTPQGEPEIRFEAEATENTDYMLPLAYRYGKTPVKILQGPIHHFNDRANSDLHMLIHQFTHRVPAFFLTAQGLIEAQLLSVRVKLYPEGWGCSYDYPTLQLACQKIVSSDDILGVYIPFDTTTPTSCTIDRKDRTHWTADLNGDGVADIAAIASTFLGEVNGMALVKVLWFANVEGQWQIVDFGTQTDCT
jgi:hypothetical protein